MLNGMVNVLHMKTYSLIILTSLSSLVMEYKAEYIVNRFCKTLFVFVLSEH